MSDLESVRSVPAAGLLSSFFQILVVAACESAEKLRPKLGELDAITWDYSPEVAMLGQTLSVGPSKQRIVFAHHPLYLYHVRELEQFSTSGKIRATFLDAALKAIRNHINAAVTNLCATNTIDANEIVGVSRHLPEAEGEKVVDMDRIALGPIVLRVVLAYGSYPQCGYTVIVDAGFGLAVRS